MTAYQLVFIIFFCVCMALIVLAAIFVRQRKSLYITLLIGMIVTVFVLSTETILWFSYPITLAAGLAYLFIGHAFYDSKVRGYENEIINLNAKINRYDSMITKMESFRFPEAEIAIIEAMREHADEFRSSILQDLECSLRKKED